MQTFSMFFSEDAGEKFSRMSDEQFADWKKKNPGASSKADELRKKATAAMKKSSAPAVGKDKELPTSAITKPGASSSYKKVLANKAKELAAGAAKKAGGALVKKGKEAAKDMVRKSDMGKWSQGIKNAPKSSAPDVSGKKKAAEFMTDPDDQNASTAASRRREREEKRKEDLEDIKRERGQKLKKRTGAVAKYLRNQLRSTVGDVGVSSSGDLGGLKQR